jgi:uncharacterized protein YndB with AHSA1/START domain
MTTPAPNTFTGMSSITIQATAEKVWDALTNPETIKQYLFGTEVFTDWQVGSPIIYKGQWKDQPYEDKGTIVALIPNKLLQTTYWSVFSEREDTPDNYLLVTYRLSEADGATTLSITTDKNPTEEDAENVSKNWAYVLQMMKDLLEK